MYLTTTPSDRFALLHEFAALTFKENKNLKDATH